MRTNLPSRLAAAMTLGQSSAGAGLTAAALVAAAAAAVGLAVAAGTAVGCVTAVGGAVGLAAAVGGAVGAVDCAGAAGCVGCGGVLGVHAIISTSSADRPRVSQYVVKICLPLCARHGAHARSGQASPPVQCR